MHLNRLSFQLLSLTIFRRLVVVLRGVDVRAWQFGIHFRVIISCQFSFLLLVAPSVLLLEARVGLLLLRAQLPFL